MLREDVPLTLRSTSAFSRLTAAATGFLEKYVATLGGAGGSGSSGGSDSGNALGGWELLEPRTSHRFTMVGEGKFETCVEWLDGMAPGATMRWATSTMDGVYKATGLATTTNVVVYCGVGLGWPGASLYRGSG